MVSNPVHPKNTDRPTGQHPLRTQDSALTARQDALARAYKAGQREVLGELYEALQPLIAAALRRAAARGLAGSVDLGDLAQQSWVILADLARRWRPEPGSFAAYVGSSLARALQRYARQQAPGRRTARVRVIDLQEQELAEAIEQLVGEDGRTWDDRLIVDELLGVLSERERAVFRLRVAERQSFDALGALLDLSPRATRRLFARAKAILRFEARSSRFERGPGMSPRHFGPRTSNLEPGAANVEPDVTSLVCALHAGASTGGLLPGRAWVRVRTGLSQGRYADLMQRLVASGCIRDRSARRPGWLVERDPEATLSHLRPAPGGGEVGG